MLLSFAILCYRLSSRSFWIIKTMRINNASPLNYKSWISVDFASFQKQFCRNRWPVFIKLLILVCMVMLSTILILWCSWCTSKVFTSLLLLARDGLEYLLVAEIGMVAILVSHWRFLAGKVDGASISLNERRWAHLRPITCSIVHYNRSMAWWHRGSS